ncbi:hypothetical protein F5B17DRAFT_48959 [Nemania serpens]|nr:hypothetical protein F5B17DRAFT_48959 [Nemania serpens]
MYARGPLRTLQLAAVLALASAATLRPNPLFERDGTCDAGFSKCSQAGLPDNFCCPTASTCNVLAGGTTVLCCPSGSNCATIKAISCTIDLQDPKLNPSAALKTTALDQKLPTCGKGCCPFGYHCDGSSANCVMDTDQSKKPGQASSAPSSTSPKPTSTSGSSSTANPNSSSTTAAAASTETTSPAAESTGAAPAPSTSTPSSTAAHTLNTAGIVGGVVGGLLGLSLIIAGICVLRHKRKKGGASSSSSPSSSHEKRDSTHSFGHIISAPMPHADYYNQRLDFLAKAQSSSTPTTTAAHPHSPYSPYTMPSLSRPNSGMTDAVPRSHHASAEVGGLRNLTERYSGGLNSASGVSNNNNNHQRFNNNNNNNNNNTQQQQPPQPQPQPQPQQQQQQGEKRMHSINVFADPLTVGSPSAPDPYNRRETTWSDLQHRADHDSGTDSPVPRR